MIDHFHFSPDPEHAARSDRAMHAGLADSLRQICKASDGKVEFDRVSVERLIADIESGRRLSPNAFAISYELVPALLENRLDEARTLFAELARQRPIETPFRMLAFARGKAADGRGLSRDFVSARMHWAMSRLIASDLLTDEELALAVNARDDDKRNFERGYQTVAAHARLTDTGRIALDAALAYMHAAA